jgi:hypothetical protein
MGRIVTVPDGAGRSVTVSNWGVAQMSRHRIIHMVLKRRLRYMETWQKVRQFHVHACVCFHVRVRVSVFTSLSMSCPCHFPCPCPCPCPRSVSLPYGAMNIYVQYGNYLVDSPAGTRWPRNLKVHLHEIFHFKLVWPKEPTRAPE